jgi:hypothetical protein
MMFSDPGLSDKQRYSTQLKRVLKGEESLESIYNENKDPLDQ